MDTIAKTGRIEAFCVIVQHGQASRIFRYAKQLGVFGGTVILGKGTVKHNRLLNILDLTDSRKEILLMLLDMETVDTIFSDIAAKFKFEKRNHGVAFTIPVDQMLGAHMYHSHKIEIKEDNPMFKAIFTVVDRGKAEDVITAATEAGARGGTIINARGSGIHETTKVFNMEISPEKEVVLILAQSEKVDSITEKIIERLDINKPGNGIIFIQDVRKTFGLY